MKLRIIRRKLANNFKNHQILEDPKYDKTSTIYDAYQLILTCNKYKIKKDKWLSDLEIIFNNFLKDIPDKEYLDKNKNKNKNIGDD